MTWLRWLETYILAATDDTLVDACIWGLDTLVVAAGSSRGLFGALMLLSFEAALVVGFLSVTDVSLVEVER